MRVTEAKFPWQTYSLIVEGLGPAESSGHMKSPWCCDYQPMNLQREQDTSVKTVRKKYSSLHDYCTAHNNLVSSNPYPNVIN